MKSSWKESLRTLLKRRRVDLNPADYYGPSRRASHGDHVAGGGFSKAKIDVVVGIGHGTHVRRRQVASLTPHASPQDRWPAISARWTDFSPVRSLVNDAAASAAGTSTPTSRSGPLRHAEYLR